jgi:hypothetical protein
MRDLAEIWANASDHDINNFSSWWTKIHTGFFELHICLKIDGGHGKSQRPPLSYSDPALISKNLWGINGIFGQKVA